MYLSQLPSSSDSFIRYHSDYQWLLTTNKQHLEAPKIDKFLNYTDTVNAIVTARETVSTFSPLLSS